MDRDLAFIAALLRIDIFDLIREADACRFGWGPRRAGAVSCSRGGRRYQRRVKRIRKT